jgi:uncharacterized protein
MRFTCLVLGMGLLPAAGFGADTRIAEAAMHQDNTAVRSLIQQKADVNAVLPDGATALHWAANADDLDTVNLLIQAGADVKVKDRYGFTPLYFAATNGNAAVIRKLLEAGADPNAADASGETALMTATRSGNADALKALLQNGARVNAQDSVTQQTALMWAVRSNSAAAVQLLVEYGADVNVRTRIGKAPAARPPGAGGGSHGVGIVRSGWPERGFQPETPGGMTPLLYAARDGRFEKARLLVAAKAESKCGRLVGQNAALCRGRDSKSRLRPEQ